MFSKIVNQISYKFNWVRVYKSPFKPPRIKFYLGKVRVGFPYFLPRRLNKNRNFVKKKIGFSACGLGYKTKWTPSDYRFEWQPCYGFVFYKLQFCIWFIKDPQEWESWLLYRHFRRRGLSNLDALVKTRETNPNVWVSYKDGAQEKTDWFLKSLKNRFKVYFEN